MKKVKALFVFIILIIVISFYFIAYAAVNFYRGYTSQNIIVDEQSVCKSITNTGNKDVFIPTKTSNEWSLFRQNKPAYITLGDCYYCSQNSQTYSDQTTCNSACLETANCTQNCSTTTNIFDVYSNDVSQCASCSKGSSYDEDIWNICGGQGYEWIASNVFNCNDASGDYCSNGIVATCRSYSTTCTYSCPLSGGSACSGSPQTCTSGQSCTVK